MYRKCLIVVASLLVTGLTLLMGLYMCMLFWPDSTPLPAFAIFIIALVAVVSCVFGYRNFQQVYGHRPE